MTGQSAFIEASKNDIAFEKSKPVFDWIGRQAEKGAVSIPDALTKLVESMPNETIAVYMWMAWKAGVYAQRIVRAAGEARAFNELNGVTPGVE